MWDAATGRELLTLKGQNLISMSVTFSPDGRQIATGGIDATAKVWNGATGELMLTLEGHSTWVCAAAFSPRTAGGLSPEARIKPPSCRRRPPAGEMSTFKGHRNGILSVAFSPDGQRFATGSFDGTAKVWEAAGDQGSVALKITRPN